MTRKTTKKPTRKTEKTREQLMEELNRMSNKFSSEEEEEFDSESVEEEDEDDEPEVDDDDDDASDDEGDEHDEDDEDDEDTDDGDEESEDGPSEEELKRAVEVAIAQKLVAAGAAEKEVSSTKPDTDPDGPPPEGFQDLRPRVRVNMAVRSDVLTDELAGQWHWGDDQILAKIQEKLEDWAEMVPGSGAALRVYLSVLYHTGGRPLEAEDICTKSSFVRTMMELATELDERYRYNVAGRDPHFAKQKEEEPEEEPLTMQERLAQGFAVFSKAQGAAAAINEIHAAQSTEVTQSGQPTSVIKYLAHPAVQALFDDDEALSKVSELVGMESVMNVIRAVGGPLSQVSMVIDAMKRMGG